MYIRSTIFQERVKKGVWRRMVGMAGKTEGDPKVQVALNNRVGSHDKAPSNGMLDRSWKNVILGMLKKKFP